MKPVGVLARVLHEDLARGIGGGDAVDEGYTVVGTGFSEEGEKTWLHAHFLQLTLFYKKHSK